MLKLTNQKNKEKREKAVNHKNIQKWLRKAPIFDDKFEENIQSDDLGGKNQEIILTMHKR